MSRASGLSNFPRRKLIESAALYIMLHAIIFEMIRTTPSLAPGVISASPADKIVGDIMAFYGRQSSPPSRGRMTAFLPFDEYVVSSNT